LWGTVQLSAPSSFPPFISWVHVSIAGSQIINDRLNILSMISLCFFKFCCKNNQHCEIYDRKNVKIEWPINYRITIAKVANLLGTQERRFRLRNPIILQPECSRLKFPGHGTAFQCVPAYFNPCSHVYNATRLLYWVDLMKLQLTLLRIISGARYSGVPHSVHVRPFTRLANPKSVIYNDRVIRCCWMYKNASEFYISRQNQNLFYEQTATLKPVFFDKFDILKNKYNQKQWVGPNEGSSAAKRQDLPLRQNGSPASWYCQCGWREKTLFDSRYDAKDRVSSYYCVRYHAKMRGYSATSVDD